MRPRAHQELALTDPPEHPTAPVIPAVLVALTKMHHAQRHKGGSPRGTSSKRRVAFPSPVQAGEKLRAKADKKTEHIEQLGAPTVTNGPPESRYPSALP